MENIVIEIKKRDYELVRKKFKDMGYKEIPGENAFWRYQDKLNTVTLYRSGKLLIQGKNVERIANLISKIITVESFPGNWIGTDESGKGDLFGPLVVSGVICNDSLARKLSSIGVRDSKELSNSAILDLSKKIKKIVKYKSLILMPVKYNKLYSEMKNLNRILSWAHFTVIKELLKKEKVSYVFIDEFSKSSGLKESLKGYGVKVVETAKGEKGIAVACASIIARSDFLNCLNYLSGKYKLKLPLGTKKEYIDIARKVGKENLKYVAKLNFDILRKLDY